MTKTTTSGSSSEPPPASDGTVTTTNNHPTTSASSSSTSSSPVLVDHPSSPHDTLLMSSPVDDDDHHDDDDDGEMTSTSEDDQPHHHDPLLPEVEQSKPPECSSTMASITTTATTTSKILQMILERYQKWLIKGWKQIRHSKLSSISSSSSIPYNEWLQFYCQFISSPSHQDKILKFLQYTFYMIGQVVLLHSRRPSPPNHPPTVAPWLEQLYHALTWTRYVLRILQFPVAIDAALHQSWTRSAIPNVSSSDGGSDSSSTSSSGRSGCSTGSHKNNSVAKRQQIYNVLGRILTYSMVLYYPTELMAYLLWMKPKASTSASAAVTEIPLKSLQPSMTTTLVCDSHQQYGYMISFISNVYTTLRDPKIRDKNNASSSSSSFLLSKLFSSFVVPSMTCPSPETWSYLSCRCWLIYVITELIQSYIQYKELLLSFTQPSNPTTDSSEYRNAQQQQQQQQQIVLQTVRNVLFLIPCATWSMPKWDTQPIVPSRTVNTLLWFESIVSLYQAILIQQQNKNRPPQQ